MYDVEVTLSLQMAAYCSVLHPTVHMLPQCYTLQECGTKQHTPPPQKKNVHPVSPTSKFFIFKI